MQTKLSNTSKFLNYKKINSLQQKVLKSFFTKIKSLQIIKNNYLQKTINYINSTEKRINLLYKLKKKGKFIELEIKNNVNTIKETILIISNNPIIEIFTDRISISLRPHRNTLETFLQFKKIIKETKPISWISKSYITIKKLKEYWFQKNILCKNSTQFGVLKKNCILNQKLNNFLLYGIFCNNFFFLKKYLLNAIKKYV